MGKMLGFFILISVMMVALGLFFQGAQGGVSTVTTAPLTATATTSVSVSNTDGFKTAGIIIIGNEFIRYTGKTAASFTGLTRATGGTAGAAASTGARVYDEVLGYANLGSQYQTLQVQNEVEQAGRITLNPLSWGAMVTKAILAPPFITGNWRLVLLPWYAFTTCLLFSLALAMAGLIRTVFLRG